VKRQPRHPASHLSTAARIVVAGAGSAAVAAIALVLVALWTVVRIVAGFGQHWPDLLYAGTGGATLPLTVPGLATPTADSQRNQPRHPA
jgi:hypothetical protein